MHYKLKELSAMMRTPVGRLKFLLGIGYKFWPVLSYLTMLYRRIFIPKKRVITVVGSFGKSTTMRAVIAALGSSSAETAYLNSYSMVALNLIASRPKERYAVIEVGINGKGPMAR
jgi:UDP-N-acetylmuramyl pentapeptide synthase